MKVVTTARALADELAAGRRSGRTIVYVATMGALHEGHLSLVDLARAECEIVVSSIFVNPLQFGPDEDFDSYPRPVERDLELLADRGTTVAFLPDWIEIFPRRTRTLQEFGVHVSVPKLSHQLCGASRPGHFDGMVTESLLFLHLVRPDRTYWGEKDFQQLRVIETLVDDLRLPVRVVRGPTRRERDGLALSSRNVHLAPSMRATAPELARTLFEARDSLSGGAGLATVLPDARNRLTGHGFQVEYFVACDERSLTPVDRPDGLAPTRLFAAARLGDVRLIDNVRVTGSRP
jgi:pantoate--beta-alanine ligase